MKPSILKLSSVAEHNASPTIMGIRDKLTYIPVLSPEVKKCCTFFGNTHLYTCIVQFTVPVNMAEITTVKSGAELLIVSVKETAT